jgi:hypothetical protein
VSSTNIVNFSVRQNKGIERSIVFDCLDRVIETLHLTNLVYLGMGSVWFADFMLAHRLLGIETMISVEDDEIIFKRAEFNKPFRTVEVLYGSSVDVIPPLLTRDDLAGRPWIAWLDYDDEMDEDKLEELDELLRTLPHNSVLLTTFQAHPKGYGILQERPKRIKTIFGDAAPEGLSNRAYKDHERMMAILAKATEDFLVARSIQSARLGGFVPMVRLMYVDSMPMVTVGGILPSQENEAAARQLVADPNWPGIVTEVIQVPPLTPREVSALQAQLPNSTQLRREDVIKLGFDLAEEQLRSFTYHYLRYPQFAQISR